MSLRRTNRILAIVAVACLVWAAPAAGVPREWVGGSGNWYETTYWSPTGSPVSSDHLLIQSGAPASGSAVTSDGGGSITFDGAGAHGFLADTTIGDTGVGALRILNGAQLTVFNPYGYVVVASQAGSSGTVLVGGTGSTWTNNGDLYVGVSGTGSLSIADGGRVSNALGWLGAGNYLAKGSGTATVSGSGSTWTNNGQLILGFAGTGSMSVSDGGNVSNGNGYLGYYSGDTGRATVSGAGSKWTNTGGLDVGHSGSGRLDVTAGGQVSNTASEVGSGTGSDGTATVSGTGSTWTSSLSLWVGSAGTGSLSAINGGQVASATGEVGYATGSSGTVTLSGAGSGWTCSGDLAVGRSGTGTLNIRDGAAVRTDGALYVAANSGSAGTVNLESGSLTASSIGASAGTRTFNWTGGLLNVTGADGLALATTGPLGTNANLSPGRALNVTKTTTVGSGVTLTLAGGSLATNALTVNGTARLRSGAATINDTFTVNGTGQLEINGHDIALATTPTLADGSRLTLISGSLSAPALNVPSGATVNLDRSILSPAGTLTNSGAIMGNGRLDAPVVNSGNIAFSGDSDFTGDVTNNSGGKIIISGGSGATFFEDVVNGSGAEIRVSQGCTATYFGSVSGSGNFTGTGISYLEGDMRPGASPGLAHFEGDVVLGSGAALDMELGATTNDRLDVDGALTLDGALDVTLYDGFTPKYGDTFDLLDWGTLDGSFREVDLPGLTGALIWNTSQLYLNGELSVDEVPEPCTMLLFGTGALGALGWMRRRRMK